MDSHSFDTHRDLAMDFAGNLESISGMTSLGMESEFAPLFMIVVVFAVSDVEREI